MCNIAGYVGERSAAPMLIEMMKKQEGFAGGYYSGIATICDGKIYYAKLTGDVKRLITETDAASFPGNIGIIHSRSKSGGGDEWAHPFIGCRNGAETEAYVANGYAGKFAICDKDYNALAEKLISDGWKFGSKITAENKNYQSLSDGTTVHMSDVMCQLITRNISNGANAVQAMSDAFCEMPNEIVGLLLSLTNPGRIFWSRINRPMMLAFAPHGAYLATTAMAFPEDSGEVVSLPVCCSGYVCQNSFKAVPYKKAPADVSEIDAYIFAEAYEKICASLKEEGRTFKYIEKEIVRPLFKKDDCAPNALLSYEVLRSLKNRNKLKIEIVQTEGAAAQLSAPQFKISIV